MDTAIIICRKIGEGKMAKIQKKRARTPFFLLLSITIVSMAIIIAASAYSEEIGT
jgi:hypothetical protein